MTSRLKRGLLLLGVAVVLAPGTISAGSYKWVDEKGNVTYSDRPPQPADSPTAPAEIVPLNLKNLEVVKPATPVEEQDYKKYLPPAVVPRSGPTRVDDLLELTGVRAHLVGLSRGIAKELRPAPGIMSAKDQASIDRVLAKSLRPEALYGLLREAFIPQVDRTNLEATAAWLRSPLGRRITMLEVATVDPSFEQKVAGYTEEIKANRLSDRRVELIWRLDWVMGSSDSSADLYVTLSRGVTKAVAAAGPPERRLRPGQIEEQVAEIRARVRGPLSAMQHEATRYAYRDLSDDELTAYVVFASSDAGRWYHHVMHKAMLSAVSRTVEQTAAELIRAVPVERWARAAQPAPQAVR
jgi:Domain of unknown function (DUF4124)